MINEADLQRNFEDFTRKLRYRWYIRNEPTDNFRNVPAFRPKSFSNAPASHPCVELFLSRLEKETFSIFTRKPQRYNFMKEEGKAMGNLAEDGSIIIKPVDKGSCVVI